MTKSLPITDGQIDAAVGTSMVGIASTGATVSFITEVISYATLGINFMLAVAGLYLVYLRIRKLESCNKPETEKGPEVGKD